MNSMVVSVADDNRLVVLSELRVPRLCGEMWNTTARERELLWDQAGGYWREVVSTCF